MKLTRWLVWMAIASGCGGAGAPRARLSSEASSTEAGRIALIAEPHPLGDEVAVALIVDAGARHAPPGIAALTAFAIAPPDSEPYVSSELVAFRRRCAAEDLDRCIAGLVSLLGTRSIDEERLLAAARAIEERRGRATSDGRDVEAAALAGLTTWVDPLTAVGVDAMGPARSFLATEFGPERALVVVLGDVDGGRLTHVVRDAAASLPAVASRTTRAIAVESGSALGDGDAIAVSFASAEAARHAHVWLALRAQAAGIVLHDAEFPVDGGWIGVMRGVSATRLGRWLDEAAVAGDALPTALARRAGTPEALLLELGHRWAARTEGELGDARYIVATTSAEARPPEPAVDGDSIEARATGRNVTVAARAARGRARVAVAIDDGARHGTLPGVRWLAATTLATTCHAVADVRAEDVTFARDVSGDPGIEAALLLDCLARDVSVDQIEAARRAPLDDAAGLDARRVAHLVEALTSGRVALVASARSYETLVDVDPPDVITCIDRWTTTAKRIAILGEGDARRSAELAWLVATEQETTAEDEPGGVTAPALGGGSSTPTVVRDAAFSARELLVGASLPPSIGGAARYADAWSAVAATFGVACVARELDDRGASDMVYMAFRGDDDALDRMALALRTPALVELLVTAFAATTPPDARPVDDWVERQLHAARVARELDVRRIEPAAVMVVPRPPPLRERARAAER